MSTSVDFDGLQLIQHNKQPINIVGVPGRLQTTLTLKNTTDQRQTLKQLPLVASDLLDREGNSLSSALLSGRIDGQNQSTALLDLPIDPKTAPGTYQIIFQLGGESIQASVLVYEAPELEMEPDNITVHTGKDLQFEHHFTLSNVGNVPLSVGQDLVLPIQGQGDFCHMLRDALVDTNEQLKKPKDQTVSQLFPILLERLTQRLPSSATFSLEPAHLLPGQSQLLNATLQLPDNLQPNQYYTVNVELYGAAISFDVYAFEADTKLKPSVKK